MYIRFQILGILLLNLLSSSAFSQIQSWVTHPAGKLFLQQAIVPSSPAKGTETLPCIFVNELKTFQSMDGFGCTLTGGSTQLLAKMSPENRATLLKELFDPKAEGSIGISYLRISVGASDLSDHVFSYNDLPAGQTDPLQQKFSLEQERKDFLPILKEILRINPAIKIMGSPWSPPTWMKTNGDSKGGSLKPEHYAAYALYLVKYIQAMQKEGVAIDALTVQNEPLHPGNNPSLLMYAHEQADFVKNHLGPAFVKNGIKTKILVYDHNADRPDYPISILNDPAAKKYIDGSAFHLYGGTVDALSEVHDAHPDKNLYFTEQWIGAPGNMEGDLLWHIKTLMIGASRNWAKNVLEWNLANDLKWEPHTVGGCTECLGVVTLDQEKITRNPAYYIIAHAAKFVRPGSKRILSNTVLSLANVAFKTPDGRTVLLVTNDDGKEVRFRVNAGKTGFTYTLPAKSVATLVW